ncbi:fibrobacter succinogenes major paralogous domain-containing protein [Flavobacterium psychrotolerans]|uniref:fibrobacter succinogenes major paralogous domain-containing protein n=1 Tax=Flavobacterium psychrotolerans TaxID=2169410 RepID=UPI001FB7DE74|nr:fibrobacter succinogenes major paralogous domain-containing protein [Flavobacterium psychrotolerans]
MGNGVTDIEGTFYNTVIIGTQEWTKQNLNTSHYRNGDIIPQVTDLKQWSNLTTGAWCYYNNDTQNGTVYGKLYNWYAVNDPRGLAPKNWSIPSQTDWVGLDSYLGGFEAGNKMKEEGVSHWSKSGGNNESGFTGIPGGRISINQSETSIIFHDINEYGVWWSTTSNPSNNYPYYIFLLSCCPSTIITTGYKNYGFSVRCLKNRVDGSARN